MGVRRVGADLRFDLSDPLLEPAFDLLDGAALAEMSGLVEVMKVRPQFEQELLGKAMAHDGLILYT